MFNLLNSFSGSDRVATSISCRIVHGVIFMTSFLVFAHYTSWLYAELTIVKIVNPIDSFQAMLDDGSYKLGLMRGWAVHTEIEVLDKINY